MSEAANKTATGAVKVGFGKLKGIFVSSVSGSPTITLHDGINATPAAAVKAAQTLTISGAILDGMTVTIGTGANQITYTFKTALSPGPIANQVLIGVSDAVALDNLKLAINAGAGAGTVYSTGTVAHAQVTATTNTDTTQVVEAVSGGVWGNAITVAETVAGSWGAAKLAGGLDAVTLLLPSFIPVAATLYDFGMSAGQNQGGVDFVNGLYYTEGGTVDCTFFFE